MVKERLDIGTLEGGDSLRPFTLPADLGDKKIAVLAQSKKGKTYGLGVILEELAQAQRPFIATDPANNLWGLRVLPDGQPSGLQVVVIGGDHADIPFERDAGERMAEALLATPICAVIDLAFESTGAVRRFMTDFAGRLMRTKPEIPRVVVLEEAPVLIPQNAFGIQAQLCKTAVSKLATIGGNFGYGVIPACQRPATMDKDVLSQCEALIVMGITHAKDRKTVKEWMEAKDIGDRVADCFAELGSLQPGYAWYWNPGEDLFQKFKFRKRRTLHPREMQKLGLKASAVQLGDMQAFVDRMKREMSRTVAVAPETKPQRGETESARTATFRPKTETNRPTRETDDQVEIEDLRRAKSNLEAQLAKALDAIQAERRRTRALEQRLETVRKHLKPQYDTLEALFRDLGEIEPGNGVSLNRAAYEPWLLKAGRQGCRRVLEVLLDKPELTRHQLGILSGTPPEKSTFRSYMAWLKRAGLVEVDGDTVRLRAI